MPNPLPPELSLSAVVCQSILRETDGVNSAIRIVDVWFVSEPRPDTPLELLPVIQANVILILRADAGYEREHEISLRLQNTTGEVSDIGAPVKPKLGSRFGPAVPAGATFALQMNLIVKRLGVCYVLIYFDGELAMRVPLTLLPQVGTDAND